MKKKAEKRKVRNGMRPEYDPSELKGRVRGKFTALYNDGKNLVLLSPDVAEHFPNDQAVNRALRKLIPVAKSPVRRVQR